MSIRGQSRDGPQSRSWDINEEGNPPITKTKSSQRGPPPSLFLHPSPGASHVSLPGILAPGASVSSPSATRREQSNLDGTTQRLGSSGGPPEAPRSTRGAPSSMPTRTDADRTDALWAEMQATLEEVELSASGGTHVFGPEHDSKLADLRTAQIALAQAWARSEADDAIETTFQQDLANGAGAIKAALSDEYKDNAVPDGKEGAKNPAASSGETERLQGRLDEETEDDIRLARRRREANDEYFQRVNEGVIDVIAKLEEVAIAMRAVEQESRDVWPDAEAPPAGS